jgi:hypothetical protein
MVQRIKYHVMTSTGGDNSSVSLGAFNTKEEAEAFRDAQPTRGWIEVAASEVPAEAASIVSFVEKLK